jgi:hypothetical protein
VTATFDAVSSGDTAGTPATSVTVSHTIGAGANMALIVIVSANAAASPTSVTYNGVAMTSVGTVDSSAGNRLNCYRLENPAAGAHNIVATYAANHEIGMGAISVSDADQTNCVRNSASATGTSSTPSAGVTSDATDLCLAGLNNDDGRTGTVGTNETERWDAQPGANLMRYLGYTEAGAAGTVTIAPTLSGSSPWAEFIVSIKGAAGGAGLFPPFPLRRIRLGS